ncbi:serine hydrolase domain-containing protein [Streptomyces sp. NBC_01264]|uniref:serine hydrolase domain-containing protein n=1 Tax=Streptomyces sp. NBC_01264 TaxID=2903804 RepID=UPI0022567FDB|nr:serine hydrolase domain-containing protein [Streptomyces sp. NBC_01264]MCX4777061.1 beta-lactamase family protein [Streptomyces sp. NBC_01264]
MRKADIPGVGVGLWFEGGGSYERAFGTADTGTGTPMKTGLHTRIGSVTKTFTITAVLHLVDQGELSLDAPVLRYLRGPLAAQLGKVAGADKVTVRQLAEMRSGLFDYTSDTAWLAELQADPTRGWTPPEVLGVAFAHPMDFAPGAKWEYSNTNTVLLGVLVEQLSGRSLADYLRDHVLEPVGLADTALPKGAEIPSPYAHGYTTFSPGGKLVDASSWKPSWGWAAGAMTSTLDDLHTWVPALTSGRTAGGDPLLRPDTQAERMRVLPTGYPGVGYGLGIAEVNGWVGHNGELPGYETIAAGLPKDGAVLVVIVNSDQDDAVKDAGSLSSLIGRTVTEIATPDHVWSLPAAAQPDATPDATPGAPASGG